MDPKDIKDQIRDQLDVPYSVDLSKLTEADQMIGNIASIVLGGIAYCIVILMTLVTAIDICYLTIPVVRERIQTLRWDGTKNKHLRAVSRDAVAAVEDANTIITGKSVLAIYLIKRIKTYVLSVFVLVLIIGGMDYIKDIAVIIVKSIMKVIQA